MAEERDQKTCEHTGCNCPAADDSDYCSVYCEGAGDTTTLSCSCGHEGCEGEII